jgi:hypothetical protein
MQKADDFIAKRLTWKAGKYKLPTNFAFFFEDLTSTLREYLSSQLDTETSGAPILFFTKPTKEWTLVCTKQVVCNNNEKIFKVNLCDIVSLRPAAFEKFAANKISLQEAKKAEWDEIAAIDNQNNKHILHADKGSDLFTLCNILLM